MQEGLPEQNIYENVLYCAVVLSIIVRVMWESGGILRPEAQAEGLSIPEVIFLKTEKYFPF